MAVFFAWRAAHETRQLRREERLGRIAELVGEVGTTAEQAKATGQPEALWVAQLRLGSAVMASGEMAPRCLELSRDDLIATQADVPLRARDALRELAPLILTATGELGRAELVVTPGGGPPEHADPGVHFFQVRNVGEGPAFDVYLWLVDEAGETVSDAKAELWGSLIRDELSPPDRLTTDRQAMPDRLVYVVEWTDTDGRQTRQTDVHPV